MRVRDPKEAWQEFYDEAIELGLPESGRVKYADEHLAQEFADSAGYIYEAYREGKFDEE
jgi:hypothetical protein